METKEFETEIRNNPIRLLQAIKEKMYWPTRAKYDYLMLVNCYLAKTSQNSVRFC